MTSPSKKLPRVSHVLVAIFISLPEPTMASIPPCNQRVYDGLYRAIVLDSIRVVKRQEFETRNASIRQLRKLCRGQFSTYERTGESNLADLGPSP